MRCAGSKSEAKTRRLPLIAQAGILLKRIQMRRNKLMKAFES